MRVLVCAGEVSGDAAGAALSGALAAREPETQIFGIGGPRMAAAGVAVDQFTNHLGTVGVSEAVRTLPALWNVVAAVRERVRRTPPDAAVLIGNDVLSVLLARHLRSRGVPTVSFFPPQVWIWGAIAGLTVRSFDLILTCFSAEQEVYGAAGSRHGRQVIFVGHYLADSLGPGPPGSQADARRALGLNSCDRVVGVLPGSRTHEVSTLSPVLLDAARELLDERPDLRLVLPVADPGLGDRISREVEARGLSQKVTLADDSRQVMAASELVLLASGTASLEAALIGVPMVIVYRVSTVTHAIVRTAIRLGLIEDDTVGLPNLILGKPVVPELKQRQATPASVAREALAILDDDARAASIRSALGEVARRVSAPDSLARAAESILALARDRRRPPRRRRRADTGA